MPAHESSRCIYISKTHNAVPKIFLRLVIDKDHLQILIAIAHYIQHERLECVSSSGKTSYPWVTLVVYSIALLFSESTVFILPQLEEAGGEFKSKKKSLRGKKSGV